MRKRFGKCLFDSGTRQLWRGRRCVALSPKALDLLELLLVRAPRAVSKDAIQSSLWPGTFVSEANLTNLISEVRAAIGETARRPRCIRTVHRFGYAFDGKLNEDHTTPDATQPVLYRLVLGRRRIRLEPGDSILGRHPDAEVRIDQTSVSRRHARISIFAGKATLEDLDSRNGTYLRGRRLDGAAEIRDGDVIGLGPISMIFRVLSDVDSTEAAPHEA